MLPRRFAFEDLEIPITILFTIPRAVTILRQLGYTIKSSLIKTLRLYTLVSQ